LLQWATKTEINSQVFEIQRSTDGKEFKAISTVASKGVASEYRFTDSPPLEGLGVVYYRLKMIDKDGKYEYSEVRIINFKQSTSKIILYPNPITNGKLNIDYGEEVKAKTNYKIATVEGRIVQQGVLANRQQTISIQTLTKGMYIIKIENKHQQFVVD
ncbi:MAG: T9SS type A sorting domain-containing protein, partial [Dolichospermum sp.]